MLAVGQLDKNAVALADIQEVHNHPSQGVLRGLTGIRLGWPAGAVAAAVGGRQQKNKKEKGA